MSAIIPIRPAFENTRTVGQVIEATGPGRSVEEVASALGYQLGHALYDLRILRNLGLLTEYAPGHYRETQDVH